MKRTKLRSICFPKQKMHFLQNRTPSLLYAPQKNVVYCSHLRQKILRLHQGESQGSSNSILFMYTHGTKSGVLSLMNMPKIFYINKKKKCRIARCPRFETTVLVCITMSEIAALFRSNMNRISTSCEWLLFTGSVESLGV